MSGRPMTLAQRIRHRIRFGLASVGIVLPCFRCSGRYHRMHAPEAGITNCLFHNCAEGGATSSPEGCA